jgi:hypothetical protein
MKKENESLSEKEYRLFNENGFKTKDVKEFIRIIDKDIWNMKHKDGKFVESSEVLEIIKRRAGKELI